jgi:hypothetical protein
MPRGQYFYFKIYLTAQKQQQTKKQKKKNQKKKKMILSLHGNMLYFSPVMHNDNRMKIIKKWAKPMNWKIK